MLYEFYFSWRYMSLYLRAFIWFVLVSLAPISVCS